MQQRQLTLSADVYARVRVRINKNIASENKLLIYHLYENDRLVKIINIRDEVANDALATNIL